MICLPSEVDICTLKTTNEEGKVSPLIEGKKSTSSVGDVEMSQVCQNNNIETDSWKSIIASLINGSIINLFIMSKSKVVKRKKYKLCVGGIGMTCEVANNLGIIPVRL